MIMATECVVMLQEPPASDTLYDSDGDPTAVEHPSSESGAAEDEKAEVDGEWG
jgi:hypothetical protein